MFNNNIKRDMKIENFENAIGALNCAIEIDEFKLKDNQVRRCFAHGEHVLLMWNEFGRAFGLNVDDDVCDSSTYEGYDELDYERKAIYDLKFG